MGDYSNCHRSLATGLRRLGHDVTVASNGSRWMDTERDIDLSRPYKGKLGGMALWRRLNGKLQSRLEGYDIVAIHNPIFLELRPERVLKVFNRLKERNGAIFMTAMGSDARFIRECLNPEGPLPVNEWTIHGKPAPLLIHDPEWAQRWMNRDLVSATDEIYQGLEGVTSILYEYDKVLERYLPPEMHRHIGLPIDTASLQPVSLPDNIGKVRFFLGRHAGREIEKGTDLLETAARTVVDRDPSKAELVIVENRPYHEYLELLKSAHVVLDQIYSYTPATNALLAMAYGLNAVSGGAPEFYDFIGEHGNRPVIDAPYKLEPLTGVLQRVVDNRHEIAERGRASRMFVEKHNATEIVARRAIDFWTERIKARQ